ncbi:VanZ family protein [Opitutales bacterium]|nr:VanZ family protein [Opitutales bacterium]
MYKFLYVIYFPKSKAIRKIIPFLYASFLQLITGVPKPEALKNFDVAEFAIMFSEQLYDYPYWLQDLSHLPLFLTFTWMSHWFYSGPNPSFDLNRKAVIASVIYAVFNEGIQAIIPDRFPSLGDLIMNLLGVILAIFVYKMLGKYLCSVNRT